MKSAAVLQVVAVALAFGQAWVDIRGRGTEGYDVAVSDSGNVFSLGSAAWKEKSAGIDIAALTSGGQQRWTHHFTRPSAFTETNGKIRLSASGIVASVVAGSGYAGYSALYIMACSPSGDSLWSRYHDTGKYGNAQPYDVAVDDIGNVFITGPASTDSTGWDIYTTKVRPSGALAWERRYDGQRHADDYGRGIALDSDGNVYVAGEMRNALNKRKPIILKYDSSGTLVWDRLFGVQEDDNGGYSDIGLDPTGRIYAAGWGWLGAPSPVAMYSSGGDSIWTRLITGQVSYLAPDLAGSVYLTGYDGNDLSTWKYDSLGNTLWQRKYRGTANQQASPGGVCLGSDGNPVVLGSSIGLGTDMDIATIKYSPAGDSMWVANFHYYLADFGLGLATDAASNVYVTGRCTDSTSGYVWVTLEYRASGPGVAENPDERPESASNAIRVVPSVVSGRCRFEVPEGCDVGGIRILDITGRVVRELELEPGSGSGDGSRCVIWNAADEQGQPVPNGIYVATASGSSAKFLLHR